MISIDVQVSGSQLARAIADDPEELAEFLMELAERGLPDSFEDYLYNDEKKIEVLKMIKEIYDAIE